MLKTLLQLTDCSILVFDYIPLINLNTLPKRACQRGPFEAKMWHLHIFFSFIVLIQYTSGEKSLTNNNWFPKTFDRQRNDLSYLFLYFEHNFFFFCFYWRSIFYFPCCYSIVIYSLFVFHFSLS
jgi:hypothetical protein